MARRRIARRIARRRIARRRIARRIARGTGADPLADFGQLRPVVAERDTERRGHEDEREGEDDRVVRDADVRRGAGALDPQVQQQRHRAEREHVGARRQRDRERGVAVGEVHHRVRHRAAGRAAERDQRQRDVRREVERARHRVRDGGHQQPLRREADAEEAEVVPRLLERVDRDGARHPEHHAAGAFCFRRNGGPRFSAFSSNSSPPPPPPPLHVASRQLGQE